jgi:hypothetical protein
MQINRTAFDFTSTENSLTLYSIYTSLLSGKTVWMKISRHIVPSDQDLHCLLFYAPMKWEAYRLALVHTLIRMSVRMYVHPLNLVA